MKKYVRYIVLGLAALLLAGYAAYAATRPFQTKLLSLEPKEAHVWFTESGVVSEGSDLHVYPGVSGYVRDVLVRRGDLVEAGDVLVGIDPEAYVREKNLCLAGIRGIEASIETALADERLKKEEYASAIAELEARLASIEAERQSAQSERFQISAIEERVEILRLSVARAEWDADFWAARRGEADELLRAGAISESDFAETESQHQNAKSLLAQCREELEAGEREMRNTDEKTMRVNRSADKYYDSLAAAAERQILTLRENLQKNYAESAVRFYGAQIAAESERVKALDEDIAKCQVRAPARGYVKEIPAKDMSWLPPQAAAAVLKIVDGFEIESYVSAKDVGYVRVGDEADVIFRDRGADRHFTGIVREVLDWAEPRQSALGIEEKKVRVAVAVAQAGDAAAAEWENAFAEAAKNAETAEGAEEAEAASHMAGAEIAETASDKEAAEIAENAAEAAEAAPTRQAAESAPIAPAVSLKPGFDVDVRYTVYRAPDQIMVPNSAIFQVEGADCVFVSENGRAAVRAVSAGFKASAETVIESGLSAGDVIGADANAEGLSEGIKCAPAP
jgi:HlyD family secretion protein